MLFHEDKVLLDQLRALTKYGNGEVYVDSDRNLFIYNGHEVEIKCKNRYATIKSLVRNGCLDSNGKTIRLTQKALHPYELAARGWFNYIATTVFVPIIVSILTTLVTLWIQGNL